MKKKRKKHAPPVNVALSRARHKKDYVCKLQQLCRELVGPQITGLVTLKELERLYERRAQIGRVMSAPGCEVKKSVIKGIKALLSMWLRGKTTSVHGREICMRDYFTVWFSLVHYAQNLKPGTFHGAAEFTKAFEPYFDVVDMFEPLTKEMSGAIQYITAMYSDFDDYIYYHNYTTRCFVKDRLGIYVCTDIHCYKPEKMFVEVDGLSREAVRLGWGYSDPDPMFHDAYIDGSLFQKGAAANAKKFPVYAQHHTLQRLLERMGQAYEGILHHSLAMSVISPVICTNSQGKRLVEYRYRGFKTGYLLAEIHGDIILLRTFLFLTNNGTPEGQKLMENTGLKKEDKMYLAIDQLSTFVNSDIRNNETLKNIFIEAGCASLFDLDPSLLIKAQNMQEKPLAMKIAHYLGLEMDEKFMKEVEEMEE